MPGGDAGTMYTLERMRDLVYSALRDPVFVGWAQSIAGTGSVLDRVRAIIFWAREYFMYQLDPLRAGSQPVEDFLVDPRVQRARWYNTGLVWGDCDDGSMLVSAIALAAGIPAKF